MDDSTTTTSTSTVAGNLSLSRSTVTHILIVAAIAMTVAACAKTWIRKALVAFGYPDLEMVHPQHGKHKVGALRVRLTPNVPACQIFYPVESTSTKKNDAFVPYFRPVAVTGTLKFMGMENTAVGDIVRFLEEAPHPLAEHYGADPLPVSNNQNSKFPLAIFSHGLGGTMEMYGEICSQLASTGIVVIAPEHADTSASYASKLNKDGTFETVWYQPPDYSTSPYSREKMIGYRGPHLEERVDELTALYDLVRSLQGTGGYSGGETASEDVRLAHKILATSDPSDLHLVGHSFGGSTQLLASQRWAIERNEGSASHKPIVPRTVTVVDTWNFALSDEIIAKGIPSTKDDPPPLLSVISDDWAKTNSEVEPLLEFLRNSQAGCKTVQSFYAKNSLHMSFSDVEAWMPTALARGNNMMGKSEERHATIRAVVDGFVQQKQSLTVSNKVLEAFPLDVELESYQAAFTKK